MASAWHNQPELKAAGVAEIQAHRAAGTLVRLRDNPVLASADGFQGGFHICLSARRLAEERQVPVRTLLADGGTVVAWLAESERLWGIPQVVGALLDRCFERMPAAEAPDFAAAAVDAIPAGAELDQVATRWLVDLLADGEDGVATMVAADSPEHAAIERVAGLLLRRLAGDRVTEWQAVAAAAQGASARADAAGPGAPAAATAYAAAAAYAPAMLPAEIRVAAWTASAHLADEAAANAYRAAYLETEAFAKAADFAATAVEAVADAAFREAFAPIREAAQRARAATRAGQAAAPADAAAADQARQAGDAARATCVAYYRWQADRLIQHLTQAGQPHGEGNS